MHAASPRQVPVTPLLKWAGGKRQLLERLSGHYPGQFQRYVEPFLGSGAVFFDLFSHGRLDGRQACLSDVNGDLIGCYVTVRDRPEEVIAALAALEQEHRARGNACYYDVRDRRFNPQRAALRADAAAPAYTPALAAMLIFLNRTGFNGLFRLNRQGAFNVPVGRYARPVICDPRHVRAVAEAFRAPGVRLAHRPFADALAEAAAGDFVYCDPPYEPLSRTASFASYTAQGFTMFDQRALQRAVIAACRRGAAVVVSNSSAPLIVDTYEAAAARRAGLQLERVPARRAINARAAGRGTVDELIISNVRPELGGVKPRMLRAGASRARPTGLRRGA